jgi:hypothetical protein
MQNFQINALLVEREKLLPSPPSSPFSFHAADTNKTYLRRKLGQKSRHFLMGSEKEREREQGTKLTAPCTRRDDGGAQLKGKSIITTPLKSSQHA